MPLQTLSSSPFLTVSYDAINSWLYADWQGVIDLTLTRQGRLSIEQALEKLPCHKLLNDNSGVEQIVDMDEWPIATLILAENTVPSTHYVAWILSPHVRYNHLLLASIQLQPAPVTMFFDDLTAGYEWLQHCDKYPAHVTPPTANVLN